MENNKAPIWLWPNILSLDAPLVAIAWVWMLQKALYVQYVDPAALWVLFGAVWSIYVIDRIIDVWTGKKDPSSSYRHQFSWRFRWPLIVAVLLVIIACIRCSLFCLPISMLTGGIVGFVLCLLYFVSIPFQTQNISYAKNLGAGLIFAFGVSVPISLYAHLGDIDTIFQAFHPFVDTSKSFTKALADTGANVFRMVAQHLYILFVSMEILLFGLLCVLNITAIDLWENARKSDDLEVKATNETILSIGALALVFVSFFWASVMADEGAKPYFYAIMAAGAVLHLINRVRGRFTLDGQRVLADVALLVPLPFYYIFTK